MLRYLSLYHNVPAPALYHQDGDWRWDNYENRFHSMRVDPMDVLSGYGASRFVGLGDLSRLLMRGPPDTVV